MPKNRLLMLPQAGTGLGFENTPQREARLSVAP